MANIDIAERQKIIGQRIREGRDTYAGRLDAWHTLGNVTGKFSTWKEILAAAGQAFQVVKLQLSFMGEVEDAYGVYRVDSVIPKGLEKRPVRQIQMPDGPTVYLNFLAQVGKSYQPIQHTEGFELLDHLVGEIDGAHYETMGTLEFGKLVWGQIDPNVSIRVGNDVSKSLVTFHTSHDGSKAFDIFQTGVREVCRNTFRMGSLSRLGATLRVRHTKNAQTRIEGLKAGIAEIHKVAATMEEKLVYLSQRRTTKESLTTIMSRLFPMTKNDDGVEESSTRRDNILASVLARYEFNDGDVFPEQRGTLYNLFNSVVEYTDHERSSKENGRAESAVFGSGATLKANALDLIIAEAEKAPLMRGAQQGVSVDFSEIGLNVPTTMKN